MIKAIDTTDIDVNFIQVYSRSMVFHQGPNLSYRKQLVFTMFLRSKCSDSRVSLVGHIGQNPVNPLL